MFLEYEGELLVRGKNKKERLAGLFSTVKRSGDELVLAGQQDQDQFFLDQKAFLTEYTAALKDAASKSQKVTIEYLNWKQFLLRFICFFLNAGLHDPQIPSRQFYSPVGRAGGDGGQPDPAHGGPADLPGGGAGEGDLSCSALHCRVRRCGSRRDDWRQTGTSA